MPSIEQIGHKIVVFFKTFCDIRRIKGKRNFHEKGFFVNKYLLHILVLLLFVNTAPSFVRAEDTTLPAESTSLPEGETNLATTETTPPTTETNLSEPDTTPPAIDTQPPVEDTKPPVEKKKTRVLETKTPEQSTKTATPETKTPAPTQKPLKTGNLYMRHGHEEVFKGAVGIRRPPSTPTTSSTQTEPLKPESKKITSVSTPEPPRDQIKK